MAWRWRAAGRIWGSAEQIRRCCRYVCANVAEVWRKRRYKAQFISKLSDPESEAEETRVWIEFASRCGYISQQEEAALDGLYDKILGQLVRMIDNAEQWIIST